VRGLTCLLIKVPGAVRDTTAAGALPNELFKSGKGSRPNQRTVCLLPLKTT
jgi:hypothetical protein